MSLNMWHWAKLWLIYVPIDVLGIFSRGVCMSIKNDILKYIFPCWLTSNQFLLFRSDEKCTLHRFSKSKLLAMASEEELKEKGDSEIETE